MQLRSFPGYCVTHKSPRHGGISSQNSFAYCLLLQHCLPAFAAASRFSSCGAAASCQWRRWRHGGGVSFLAKVSFIANCAATKHNVNPQITKPKNLYLVSCFGVLIYIISRVVHTKLKIMISFPFLPAYFVDIIYCTVLILNGLQQILEISDTIPIFFPY